MSTERELAEKFKEAIETKSIDGIYPYLTDSMTYEVPPSTVGRKLCRDEWKSQIAGMLAAIQSANLELTNVIEHPLFTVVQEVLLLFNFTKEESGALKISSVVEYVDSFKVKEFKEKMASGPQSSQRCVGERLTVYKRTLNNGGVRQMVMIVTPTSQVLIQVPSDFFRDPNTS